MGIITVLTAAVTALVACRYWPRGGRAYVAAVLFPVAVALTGAIIVNRFDAAVVKGKLDLTVYPAKRMGR